MKIIYKVFIKEDKVESFKKLADETLAPEAYQIPGCRLFTIYQNTVDEREFIFHEIWDSEENVHTYKKNLIKLLGSPNPGEEFPARMNDMIETDEDLV